MTDLNLSVVEDPTTDATTISWSFGNCTGSFTYLSDTELQAVMSILSAVCSAQWAEDMAEMMAGTEDSMDMG